MDTPVSALVPQSETPALLAAFADFLEIDVGAGDAAADTVETYRRQLVQFIDWCDRQDILPAAATKEHIKKYRRWAVEAGFKPSTVALKLSVVRRFYQAAVERGLLTVNPATGVKPPREKRDPAERITYLESEEVERLLAAVPRDGTVKSARDRALLSVMAMEGPRTVELHRANVADLVRQGRNWGIRVEGKRSLRMVPLLPEIADLFDAYLEARQRDGEAVTPSSPLFVAVGNRAGRQRLSRRGIRTIVDKHLERAKLKHAAGRTISTHSLRHTAGTLALRSGAELRQVQDLLGHADPRTTCIYAHIGDRWENNPARRLGIKL